MKKLLLGNTGLEVTRLCFGALTVGPTQANLSPAAGGEIIAHALDKGINFFDTAQLYGTYPHIRRGLELAGKKHDSGIVISSKAYAWNRSLAAEAVEEARRELDRDCIEIFMLHEQESVHTLRGHAEALEALLEFKHRGIIKAVGLSTHHVAGVLAATEYGLDVVHPLLNLTGLGIVDGGRADMENAVRNAYSAGAGIFMMKPLGGGNLIKKASECLDYALSLPYVHSVAVGMQSIGEVDANCAYWESGAFTDEALEALSKKERRLHIEQWCEGCGKCVGRCGQSALNIRENAAVCNHEKCVLCGYCSTVCPAWAIKVV